MLAGRMKLNTFLLLVGASGGAVLAGVGVYLAMREPAPAAITAAPPPPVHVSDVRVTGPITPVPLAPATEPPATHPSATAPPATAAAPTGATAPATAREVDSVVLSYVGKSIGSDKLKDVTKGKPFKVNVYQDAGKPTANRAKADLDRDDKWDEKFTFADGTVTREVAPNDDEAYSQKYRWDGKGWVEGG